MANLECLIVWLNCCLLISSSSIDSSNEVIGGKFFSTHVWEVGVNLMEAIEKGYLTESPMFSIWKGTVEERWYFRLYPSGFPEATPGHVSFYLVSQNDFATRPDVELIALNKEPYRTVREKLNTTYTEFGQTTGRTDFVLLETLLNPGEGFIFDNKIKFGARVATDPAPVGEPIGPEVVTFHWALRRIAMNLPNQISMESPKFKSWSSTGDPISWSIRIYPRGFLENHGNESDTETSFYVSYEGTTPFTTNVEFFVKNARPENTLRSWLHSTYGYEGEFRGFNRFMRRNILIDQENGFVDNAEIVFGVRVPTHDVIPTESNKVAVTHTWDVGLETFQMDNRGYDDIALESPIYTVWNDQKQETWFLRLYPDGDGEANDGFVSLYLFYAGDHIARCNAEVFIVNENLRDHIRKWLLNTYKNAGDSFGWGKFAIGSHLLDPSRGFVHEHKIRFGLRLTTDPRIRTYDNPMATKTWKVSMTLLDSETAELESSRFQVQTRNKTERWHLRLHPRGNSPDHAGFVSLYLVYSGDSTTNPRAEMFIVNKKPENTIRNWLLTEFNSYGQSSGWTRFIKYSDLVDEQKGFMFGEGDSKFIKVGFRMQADSADGFNAGSCPLPQECPMCEVDLKKTSGETIC